MRRGRGALLAVSAVLGVVAGTGAAACGEDDRGGVEVEGAGTGTTGGGPDTGTTPATTSTSPATTGTTETAPDANRAGERTTP